MDMIVVSVRVNRQGHVIAASYSRGTGAVAANTAARQSCVQAAKNSRFSVSTETPAEQTGTITYKKLFKIHIILILSILSAYFCRLFSHVATATLLHR